MTGTQLDSAAIEARSLAVGRWANLFMGVSGILASFASGSDALLVDGLYSGVNFASAIIAGRVSQSLRRPADSRYPFGYDAYEPLYIKYRALVLLGVMVFAVLGSVSKIVAYAGGRQVPELVFGPILVYMVAMLAICFALAIWHRHNWYRSGQRSELLKAESQAAIVDAAISAGAGGGLFGATLLHGTPLGGLVPVSDSLVVLTVCAFIVHKPVRMFLQSLGQVAGEAADFEIRDRAIAVTQESLIGRPWKLLDVAVTQLGRTCLIVPYLAPDEPVAAHQVDELRRVLARAYHAEFGEAKSEVIVTAEKPFQEHATDTTEPARSRT